MTDSTIQKGAFGPSHIFVPGAAAKREIGHYIDCSANPCDLRPAANIIINAATDMLQDLPADKPLVILMGECHPIPAHRELQNLVTLRLHESGLSPSVCLERPHNLWAKTARDKINFDIPNHLAEDPATDRLGRASLSTSLGWKNSSFAHVSVMNQYAFCYKRGIKTAFNDAALIMKWLDKFDPATAEIIKECKQTLPQPDEEETSELFHAGQPNGMFIRNIFMARHGLMAAQRHNNHLLIQSTGMDHIFNGAASSLCAAYQKARTAVLPVFITNQSSCYGLNMLPATYRSILKHSLIIDGLDETIFYDSNATARSLKNHDYRHQDGAEEAHIKYLHKCSGGEMTLYDAALNQESNRFSAIMEIEQILSTPAAPRP